MGTIPTERFTGTPVLVSADQDVHQPKVKTKKDETKVEDKTKPLAETARLGADVGDRLQSVPGATVVADRTFPVALAREDGSRIEVAGDPAVAGHNWAASGLTPYRLVEGGAPQGAGQVVLDRDTAQRAGLHVGDRVRMQSTAEPETYTLFGLAESASGGSAVFVGEPEATRLAGHDATAYGVFGAPVDRVSEALSGTSAQVSTGVERGAVEFRDAAAARTRLVSVGAAVGGTALVVAMLTVAGTASLSVRQRIRELALLRTAGATPGQILRLIGGETLLLGLPAAVAGALAGVPLAVALYSAFVDSGFLPATLQPVHSPLPVAGAAAVVLAATVAVAHVVTRRAARVRPVGALAESAPHRARTPVVRIVSGLVVTAAAASIALVLSTLHSEPAAMPVTYLSVLLWSVAVTLLGPVLARVGVAAAGPVWRRGGVGGALAVESMRLNGRRTAAAIAPVALLIGLACTVLFVPTTLGSAAQQQADEGLRAQYVVGSDGVGVPSGAVERIRATPGVEEAVETVDSTVYVGADRRSVRGVTTQGLGRVVDPGLVRGSLDQMGPGTIAMSGPAAQGRPLGSEVRTTLGDGTPAAFRLVAVYERGLAFGDALVPFEALSPHVDLPLASSVLVRGTPDPAALREITAGYPGVAVTDRATHLDSLDHRRQQNAEVGYVLLGMIVAFTEISLVDTLAIATADRFGEISLVRLVGATARQVRSLLSWELALVLGLGAACGSAAAWCTLGAVGAGMAQASPKVDPVTLAGVYGATAALGVAAVLLPAQVRLAQVRMASGR